ncbi:hypothetical protein B566_EDAN007979 [Ephemera danica]|nr:hypothetical protein B566_EDAN007979 [Ephemera danica]
MRRVLSINTVVRQRIYLRNNLSTPHKMAAHTCALGVVAILLLAGLAFADTQQEIKRKWSQSAQDRQDWIPVSPTFRDSDVAAQEEVSTVLRPPEPANLRQQRLIQSPRQGRGSGVPPLQPYFPGDQSHLIRFPGESVPPLRVPNGPPPQHFRNPPPVFLQPQGIPPGFPPSALTQQIPFQPQAIPVFNNAPTPPNNSFIQANPDDEVQLLYVPLQTIHGKNVPSNGVPNKQKQVPLGKPFKNNTPLSFEDQLRQFVKDQGPKAIPSSHEHQFDQEQQRFAALREQEERRHLQEQALKQRAEHENRLRKEQEERARKEQEERARKEQEARERKEQEIRERQEQETRARKEQELRLKKQQEEKEQEERARYEANIRFQQEQQQQVLNSRPQFSQHTTPSLQAQEHTFQQQLKSQAPVDAPKTPTPHQPPLAVYMESSGRGPAAIEDVLFVLRDAQTIPVIDRVPDANNPPPQVFVGPAEMKAPQGFTKFELPYLSSLDSNRVERKVEQLPFFVAPLSFQPPNGYSKIPFPAPHVGSVVVSQVRQQRPLRPDPEIAPDEYASAELPSISPAIPLLVNSLQNGRGSKAQRPHVQQQFVSEDQFIPNVPQFVPQHHFETRPAQHQQFVARPAPIPEFTAPPAQLQFTARPTPLPQFAPEQYEELETPAFTEAITEPPTTTTTTAPVTRRPIHSRGRRPQVDASAAPQRTRTRPTDDETAQERRPVHRGRRPVSRQRTTTTTPEPVTEEEQRFDSSREASREQQELTVSESPTQLLVSTTTEDQSHQIPESHSQFVAPHHQSQLHQPQFSQPQYQEFEPSGFGFQQRPFPTHQQGQGFHALPVQPSELPQFEEPRPLPVHHQSVSRGQSFQTQFEASPEPAAAVDTPQFDKQQYEVPKKVGPARHHEGTQTRTRHRPPEENIDEPTFQRTRPTVFQPIVSTTPETFTHYSATPHTPITSTAYPSESAEITPHHVVKGDVGKVQHAANLPFIPTPLPELPSRSFQSEVLSTAIIEPEINQYNTEPSPTTSTVTEEPVSHTAQPLSYETPTRSRLRQQEQTDSQEQSITSPRSRLRVSDSAEQTTPSYHGQRFRGRGSSREETSEESSTSPTPRVRSRVHSRIRTTTESPSTGLRITVADIPSRNAPTSDESHSSEAPTRTRGRFRGVDRSRGAVPRQQFPRGKQQNEENGGIDLPKPVRQHVKLEATEAPVGNESPVYVPEVQFESGFVPAIDAQKSRPISTEATVVETTTLRPGRGRFNNFGTSNRVSQRRQQSRTTTTSSAEDSPTTSSPGRTNVLRSSRRQQQQTATRGVTNLRGTGGRIRKPVKATEVSETEEVSEKHETGVTYAKNPYVTIHRGEASPPATANEVSVDQEPTQQPQAQAAPSTRFRQHRPQFDEETYVEPETQYTATPQYDPQYFSPPQGQNRHNQGQYFVESTPTSVQHFSARASTTQPEQFQRSTPNLQQQSRESFETALPRQHRQRTSGRFITLDDPENPEYGEESQRSERISIQQLEGALTASLFNKDDKKEEVGYDVEEDLEKFYEPEPVVAEQTKQEEPITEESDTTDTTDEPLWTTTPSNFDESTTTISSTAAPTEPEPTTDKYALHSKTNEGKRRRIRVRTRINRPGDVFETAESQNVASVSTNILSPKQLDKKYPKNEWKLALPNNPTIDVTSEGGTEDYEKELVHLTTFAPDVETDAPVTTTTTNNDLTSETVTTESGISTEEVASSTPITPIETTTSAETTVTTESPITTDTQPPVTPRVLGTSTTTEISLETEICYRGRCVKTKVDADQMPIEKK